jgi:hypothetical protein
MMFNRFVFSIMFFLLVPSNGVVAQPYVSSRDRVISDWTPGTWNGKRSFSNVYCVVFPDAKSAVDASEQMFNGNSISLYQVAYPSRLLAAVVVSTIPAGRTVNEEVGRLLARERNAESVFKHSFGISESETKFGPTISLQVKDVPRQTSVGPFPLFRTVFTSAKQPIESLAVHRIFARGSNRFEIAVHQFAPDNATDQTHSEMVTRLNEFVDALTNALQSCTLTYTGGAKP